jgi:hypothetical protein
MLVFPPTMMRFGRLTDAIIEGRGGSAQATEDENEMAFAVGDDEVEAEDEEDSEIPSSEPVEEV